MYNILNSFKLYEPATKQREENNFVNNYTFGRAIDFTDSSSFVFNKDINGFKYDGTTFNTILPYDKYGLQEDFYYPSIGIRRKEMKWNSSIFPVVTGPNQNDGFNLFGNIIGIRKIGVISSVNISIMSISTIVGIVSSYNETNGTFIFTYSSLPKIYEEKDINQNYIYDLFQEQNWSANTFDSSINSNVKINTPYTEQISSLEKTKELQFTFVSINKTTKEITGTITGTPSEVWNISTITPDIQKIRIIPMGLFKIQEDSNYVPTANSTKGMRKNSELGVSSILYYGIPYLTNYTYAETSKDYKVKVPTFNISYDNNSDLFLCGIVFEQTSSNRINPTGYKIGVY